MLRSTPSVSVCISASPVMYVMRGTCGSGLVTRCSEKRGIYERMGKQYTVLGTKLATARGATKVFPSCPDMSYVKPIDGCSSEDRTNDGRAPYISTGDVALGCTRTVHTDRIAVREKLSNVLRLCSRANKDCQSRTSDPWQDGS